MGSERKRGMYEVIVREKERETKRDREIGRKRRIEGGGRERE